MRGLDRFCFHCMNKRLLPRMPKPPHFHPIFNFSHFIHFYQGKYRHWNSMPFLSTATVNCGVALEEVSPPSTSCSTMCHSWLTLSPWEGSLPRVIMFLLLPDKQRDLESLHGHLLIEHFIPKSRVGPPFAAITASILLGRLSTRCWDIAVVTSIQPQEH